MRTYGGTTPEPGAGSMIGTLVAMSVAFLFIVSACVPDDTTPPDPAPTTTTAVPFP